MNLIEHCLIPTPLCDVAMRGTSMDILLPEPHARCDIATSSSARKARPAIRLGICK